MRKKTGREHVQQFNGVVHLCFFTPEMHLEFIRVSMAVANFPILVDPQALFRPQIGDPGGESPHPPAQSSPPSTPSMGTKNVLSDVP
eukprot:1025336-Pelagomonas_calceolata.AAC.4